MPEAKAGLERALKDPSKEIRSAARLALLKLQRESSSKKSG
jgi:HEAT repeat protein